MKVNVGKIAECLKNGQFTELFVEHLGWNNPSGTKPTTIVIPNETNFEATPVAELMPFAVFRIYAETFEQDLLKKIHNQLAKQYHNVIVIFASLDSRQQVWQWMKREEKPHPIRSHAYFADVAGSELEFISKIAAIAIDLKDLDDSGKIPLLEVERKVREALDNVAVNKKFYEGFNKERLQILEHITGIPDENDRKWYVSVLVNRLMFIYFLQKKLFLAGGDANYLENKLRSYPDNYYRNFLYPLFFDGFAKEVNPAESITGKIPYLNGGLFLRHRLEADHDIQVDNKAFESLFSLFGKYNWAFRNDPDEDQNTISPAVLGYIFEKYINQKEFGAYYTRPQITEYLCRQTIHQLVLDKVKLEARKTFNSIDDLKLRCDAALCGKLLKDILPSIRLLDPACGSGAFLVAALETMVSLYATLAGRAHIFGNDALDQWIKENLDGHRSRLYEIHKVVITQNLFGVDLMAEACEIARLRLFMALVSCVDSADKLEPLPNIDFNIMAGNSLIGLLEVKDDLSAASGSRNSNTVLFASGLQDIIAKRNNLIHKFRRADGSHGNPAQLRAEIEADENQVRPILTEILKSRFDAQKVKFENSTWDEDKQTLGKPKKRAVEEKDVEALHPFHWAFQFSEAMKAGGFDAIITNPPWETFKPQDKEFFVKHSELVTKNKMTIKEFENQKDELLKDSEIRRAYMEYLDQFPHQSEYFRTSPDFRSQSAIVNGKKTGTDINLYKLFTEQCYNLLKPGGLAES